MADTVKEPRPMSIEDTAVLNAAIEPTGATQAERLQWLSDLYVRVSKVKAYEDTDKKLVSDRKDNVKKVIESLDIPSDEEALNAMLITADQLIDKNGMFNDIPGGEVKKVRKRILKQLEQQQYDHNDALWRIADQMIGMGKRNAIVDKVVTERLDDAYASHQLPDFDYMVKQAHTYELAADYIVKFPIPEEPEPMVALIACTEAYISDNSLINKIPGAALKKLRRKMEDHLANPRYYHNDYLAQQADERIAHKQKSIIVDAVIKERMGDALKRATLDDLEYILQFVGTYEEAVSRVNAFPMPQDRDGLLQMVEMLRAAKKNALSHKIDQVLLKAKSEYPTDAAFMGIREEVNEHKARRRKRRLILLAIAAVAAAVAAYVIFLK